LLRLILDYLWLILRARQLRQPRLLHSGAEGLK
jgi:hypothetical protein